MTTKFYDADANYRETKARTLVDEITMANRDKVEKYCSVNALDFLDRLERDGVRGVTEGQLTWLEQIKEKLEMWGEL